MKEHKQEYSFYEVADILEVAHTTIYNKINNKDFYKLIKQYIIKRGKQRLIKHEGIEILKNHISKKEKVIVSNDNNIKNEATESPQIDLFTDAIENIVNNKFNAINEAQDKETIEHLRHDIQRLEDLLSTLQEQIKNKDLQLERMQILLLNNQKLLESKQDKEKRTLWQMLRFRK